MIRPLFTGTTPWYAVAALMLAAVIFTVWIYKKHHLPKPWNKILPAVRILALWLIALMLLQPVLGIFHYDTIRGVIPVVIDNSGSMGIVDQYEDEEKIDVGWFLELYDPDIRLTDFKDFPQDLEAIETEFANSEKALEESDPEDAWDAAENAFEDLRAELEDKRDAVKEAMEDATYLTADEEPAEDGKENDEEWKERHAEFQKVYEPWLKTFYSLVEETQKWEDRFDESVEDDERAGILSQSGESLKSVRERWEKLLAEEDINELQKLIDRCLYKAKDEEVDPAMEHLDEMTRGDIVEYVLTQKPFRLLDDWESKGDLLIYQLNEPIGPVNEEEKRAEAPKDLSATRLGTVIQAIAKSVEKDPVAAFILLGDGNVNAGRDMAETKEILKDQDIPILSAGFGKVDPPDDIAVARVFHPDTSFKDENVSAAVVLRRKGYTDRPVKIEVLRDDEVVHTQTVEPGDENQLRVEVSFEEEKAGLHHYKIKAETLDGEILDTNNEKTFTVNILADRIKTLVIDQYPRWETRYMNMMLSRDKRVDLKTIFLGSLESLEKDGEGEPGEEGKRERGPLEKGGYPDTKEGLYAYHLIVLGDVDPTYFTREQLEDLRDFVLDRGGTLIAVAGDNYMPVRFSDGPLRHILPLQGRNVGSDEPEVNQGDRGFADVPLKLKPASKYEPVLQVGVDPEITEELWERLPAMIWARAGVRPATHAEVLVEDAKEERPILLHAYAGQGKVLYLGSDSFWRWRDRARWKYHHRFWGQVLLWATLGRTTGSGKYVKLMPSRPEYMPDQPVVLRARLLDEKGEALEDANLKGEIFNAEDELVKRMQFTWLENSGGEYRVEVRDLPKGEYRVVPIVEELEDKKIEAETKFTVKDLPTSEFVELALDELSLKDHSDEYFELQKIRDLVEKLEEKEETRERRDDIVLWDSFPYLGLIVLLLGFEWWMRKKHQLV